VVERGYWKPVQAASCIDTGIHSVSLTWKVAFSIDIFDKKFQVLQVRRTAVKAVQRRCVSSPCYGKCNGDAAPLLVE
jgi:hypothetical protein